MLIESKTLSPSDRKQILELLDPTYHDLLEHPFFLVKEDDKIIAFANFRMLPENLVDVPLFFAHDATSANLLLDQIEKLKCAGVVLIYEGGDFEAQLEEILEKRGWCNPEFCKIRCLFDIQTFDPAWMHYTYALPEGYEIFFWRDLQPKERELIKHWGHEKVFHPSVSPFQHEERIEFLNSLGLRYKGEVVGWLITHRMRPDFIKYAYFYTLPEHRSFGTNVKMLVDAIRLHKENNNAWCETETNYLFVDLRWIKFFKRRLAPYAEKVTYLYKTFKQLN